jgi:transcriptional regulator with XRE-family HTH domain
MEVQAAVSSEFPSVLLDDGDDALASSPYRAAMFHLRQGLHALSTLSPGSDDTKRRELERLVRMQTQVLQLLHVHFAPEGESSGIQQFGEVLQQHRLAAGLTQEQVADYAGLSLSYVCKLEQGRKPPARKAVLALCSVPDLKLVPTEVTALPAVRESSHRHAPNWYVSPGFDSVSMIDELAQLMNGSGGSVEQTFVYLDHKSALDWIQICNAPAYVTSYREGFPGQSLAKTLRETLGPVGLDLIALGPGDGKSEVRLVQHLLREYDAPSIRFYLLDISQPLLSRAFKHAVDTFNDHPGVFVCGIQGNFHHLPRYAQLHYAPARSHRRRIYTMLGNTVANLDHEPLFFQNAFSGAAVGDMLLFDLDFGYTTVADADEIRRRDPVLHRPVGELHQRFLGGPIQRYCHDAQSISFSYRIDTDRPIAGSYGLQFIATVGLPGKRTKEFCMIQARRYEPKSVIRCLAKFGWESCGMFPFTGSETRPRGLFLFQKKQTKQLQ